MVKAIDVRVKAVLYRDKAIDGTSTRHEDQLQLAIDNLTSE